MLNSTSIRKIISVLIAVILILSCSVPAFSQEIATAELKSITGNVFLKKAGGQREFRAVDGMRVVQGDWIRTDEDSSVRVVYTNGSESVLIENTLVSIKAYDNDKGTDRINIRLIVGGVWNKIKQLGSGGRYELETPTTVMGVRGTLFMTTAGVGGQANLDVLEGKVAFQLNTDTLEADQSLLVAGGSSLRTAQDSTVAYEHHRLDMKKFVSDIKPRVQKQIILDMVERKDDIKKAMDQAKKEFEDYSKEEDARETLLYSSQVTELSNIIEQFITSIVDAGQGEAFLKELEKDNIKIEDIEQGISETKKTTQLIWEEVIRDAGNEGYEIKDLLPKETEIPKDEAGGNSGEAPSKSGEAPGKSGEAPGKSGEAPGKSEEAPGKSGNAPGRQ